jgi:hypothetical protein
MKKVPNAMKQPYTKAIDTQGLRHALTTLTIAGALAGWAVLARPEAPQAATVSTTTVAQVAVAPVAPVAQVVAAPVAAAPVAAAAPVLRVVTTTAPAPVTTTRASR